MRRYLLSILAGLLGASLSSTASADVEVYADIDKYKDIYVFERIWIEKDVNIDVTVNSQPEKAAESMTLVNQKNYFNQACENCAEKLDEILDSGNDNAGKVGINQAAGNNNNQGNALSVAVDLSGGGGGTPPPPIDEDFGFANSQAEVEQWNGVYSSGDPASASISADELAAGSERQVDSTLFEDSDGDGHADGREFETDSSGKPTQVSPAGERPAIFDGGNSVDAINLFFRDAVIENSLNRNTGVLQANQSVGNNNNQTNAISIAFSIVGEGVALSEAALGQINAFNTNFESDRGEPITAVDGQPTDEPVHAGIHKLADIFNSINQNQGIVGVNQAAGNMGNQANVVSFATVETGTPTTTPGS